MPYRATSSRLVAPVFCTFPGRFQELHGQGHGLQRTIVCDDIIPCYEDSALKLS